jgi:hypothetical protein
MSALVSSGILVKLDALYVLAAHDAQAAQQNWIANAFNLTPVGGPAFEVDRGYTGGASAHLGTSFNPTTAGSPKFTQNNACMGVWSRTNVVGYEIGNQGSYIYRAPSNIVAGAINNNINLRVLGVFPNHISWSRTGSLDWAGYQAGVSTISQNNWDTMALTSADFRVCGVPTVSGGNQNAIAYFGGGLTPGEMAALHAALSAYMTAVGAA